MTVLARTGVILLAAAGTSVFGQETLLRNASFESPKEQENWFCDQAAHWERWGEWINRETTWSPTRDGECLLGYHHWRIQDERDSGIYQDIPEAQSGKQYTFTIHAYKDPGTNVDTIELRLEPSGGGKAISRTVYHVTALRTKEWTLLSVAGKPSGRGLRVIVTVTPRRTGNRDGAVKFDEAYLRGPKGPGLTAAPAGP